MTKLFLQRAGLSLVFFLNAGFPQAISQSGPVLTIEADAVSIPAAMDTGLPIKIGAAGPLPKQAMILIEGLPSVLALSRGRQFESGVWAIKPADLSALKVVAPRNAVGLTASLNVSLVAFDGTILAEQRMTLSVSDAAASDAAKRADPAAGARTTVGEVTAAVPEQAPLLPTRPVRITAPAGAVEPVPTRPAVSGLLASEEAVRLQSGREALALDDIAGARLIFEYLADRGSAVGAYLLARTYDPKILASSSLRAAFGPDEKVAAVWYAKAAELGRTDTPEALAGGR
jgi:hypothetical protein